MFSIGPTCCRLEGLAVARCTPREQGPCRWPSRVLSCVSVSPRVRWRGTPVRSRQSLPTRVTPILQRRGTVTWAPPPAGPTEGNRSAIAAGRGAAASRLPSWQTARSAMDFLFHFMLDDDELPVACADVDRGEERRPHRRRELRRCLDHHSKQGDEAA